MTNANSVKIVKTLSPPTEVGTHFRVVCMTGKNKGISYYLGKDRVIFGRSEKADVQVLDGKSSREHVELVMINDNYVLTDLGSQNGVVVNDLRVTQHNLVDGDRIIIGTTVFKFNKFIIERKLEIVEVGEDEEEYEEEDEEEVQAIEDKSSKKKKPKNEAENKRKKMIYIGVGVAVAALFLMEDEKPADNKGSKKQDQINTERSFVSESKKLDIDREREIQLNAIIHRGRREFREGNFFRAIQEFNLALILVPDHGHSSYLLSKAKQRLDEEITQNFMKAKQESDALKYMSASVSYCSILRLLKDYKDDERYKEAEKQLADIEVKLGMSKGELNCF